MFLPRYNEDGKEVGVVANGDLNKKRMDKAMEKAKEKQRKAEQGIFTLSGSTRRKG